MVLTKATGVPITTAEEVTRSLEICAHLELYFRHGGEEKTPDRLDQRENATSDVAEEGMLAVKQKDVVLTRLRFQHLCSH